MQFLNKHTTESRKTSEVPYYTIENDDYMVGYLASLTTIHDAPSSFRERFLSVKFEELMLYLLKKYGTSFEMYLYSLIPNTAFAFQKVMENNLYSSLTLEEIALLCNMSLSTFKRHFIKSYQVPPGKWLREKRLLKAWELLEKEELKSSDIYLSLGYHNLSNFSSAFKHQFGINPKDVLPR